LRYDSDGLVVFVNDYYSAYVVVHHKLLNIQKGINWQARDDYLSHDFFGVFHIHHAQQKFQELTYLSLHYLAKTLTSEE
jgi:hypothetical protein